LWWCYRVLTVVGSHSSLGLKGAGSNSTNTCGRNGSHSTREARDTLGSKVTRLRGREERDESEQRRLHGSKVKV